MHDKAVVDQLSTYGTELSYYVASPRYSVISSYHMERDSMNIRSMFEFLHGRAHHHYQSEEAKRLYAAQLISLSEKLLWLMLASFLPFFLSPSPQSLILLSISAFVFLMSGLYLRHGGLKIIDEINTGEIEIITNTTANKTSERHIA